MSAGARALRIHEGECIDEDSCNRLRGDHSGTHEAELRLWKRAGIDVGTAGDYGDLARTDGLSAVRSIALLFALGLAATVLAFDEPAPLVVIIVNHGSCTCFDDLGHNRIKLRCATSAFPKRDLGVEAGLPGRRCFCGS